MWKHKGPTLKGIRVPNLSGIRNIFFGQRPKVGYFLDRPRIDEIVNTGVYKNIFMDFVEQLDDIEQGYFQQDGAT